MRPVGSLHRHACPIVLIVYAVSQPLQIALCCYHSLEASGPPLPAMILVVEVIVF